ncbi:hypothetical protein [Candidatus Symbiobacter mobilis]|nr:hypothetical protein [Candidatus Symbiobacter mobilis]
MSHLKNSVTSDTAFIIATGPSIKRQNLALLSGKDCFTVSNAFLHPDINKIRPLVHGFACYHEPMERDNFIKWLDEAALQLPSTTTIYTPVCNKLFVQASGLAVSHNILYGLQNSLADWLWPRVKYIFPAPQTAPLLLLPLVMMLGYRKICLVGCDHTVLRDYGGFVNNFYDKNMEVRKNATDPDTWQDIVYELKACIALFERYAFYARHAHSMGIDIYNLSDDSWLRQFPFSTIELMV